MTVQLDVELNEQWRKDIGEIKSEFEALDGEEADLHVDTEDALNDVGALKTEIETLTQHDHEVDVKTKVDRDSLDNLKNIELDDVDIEVGDVGDLEGLDDLEDTNISITSDIDDDDPLLEALTGDEELTKEGTIRWESYGGRPPTSEKRSINWDSEFDQESLAREVANAKKITEAGSNTTIDFDSNLDRLDESDLKESGIVRWRSSGGGAGVGGTSHGTVKWDSDVQVTDLIQELKEAKTAAKASGASEITWEIDTNHDSEIIKSVENDDEIEKRGKVNWQSTGGYQPVSSGTATLDWDSEFDKVDFAHGLANLKAQAKASGLSEIEATVCVERCDDWKKNLQNIHKDLDPIKSFGENDDGAIEVDIVGNLDEVEGTIDRLDEEGFEPSTDDDNGGGGSPLQGNERLGRSEGFEAAAEFGRSLGYRSLGEEPGETFETDSNTDTDESLTYGEKGDSREFDPNPFSEDGAKWDSVDLDWMSDMGLRQENDAQRDRVAQALYNLGMTGDAHEADRFTRDDIHLTPVEKTRDRDNDKIRQEKFIELTKEYEQVSGFDDPRSTTDYSQFFEFDVEDRNKPGGMGGGLMYPNVDPGEGIENVLDRRHRDSKLSDRQKSVWNKLFDNSGDNSPLLNRFLPEMEEGGNSFAMKTGFIGGNDDRDGGVLSLLDGKSPFSKKGVRGMATALGGVDEFDELLAGSEKFKNGLRKLIPSMQKFYQLFALSVPLMITMGVQAAGVAASMAAVAGAGAAVAGLGMLGFGSDLNSSLKEAKQRLGTFKEELYGVLSPAFNDFAPFSGALLTTLPARMGDLTDPLSQLTVFMDVFNQGIDGGISWIADLINSAVGMEGMMEQMSLRFGSIIGEQTIALFEWLVEVGYKNQEMLITLASAAKDIGLMFFQLSMIASKLVVAFAPLTGMLLWVSNLLNNDIAIALASGTFAVWGLVTAINALAAISLSGALAGILAYGSAAVGAFMSAAAAAATALSAIIPVVTISTGGAALGLAAVGLAAGVAAYSAVAPDGASGGPSGYSGPSGTGGGSGTGSGFTGSGSGVGGGKTVINVEGDITEETLPDVESAVRTENGITAERNE